MKGSLIGARQDGYSTCILRCEYGASASRQYVSFGYSTVKFLSQMAPKLTMMTGDRKVLGTKCVEMAAHLG